MSSLYAIIADDAPGSAAPRTAHLAAHLAHVETVLDRIAVAGPLRDAAGAMVGSLLIVHAETEADARAFLEADPYFAAGVWGSIRIQPFRASAGGWIGGKGW
jgi:uncharacterized protein YciI